jgi:hypothetical protein
LGLQQKEWFAIWQKESMGKKKKKKKSMEEGREGIDGRSKGIGGSPCGRRNPRFALVCVFVYLCLCFGTYLVVFIFNNNNKIIILIKK